MNEYTILHLDSELLFGTKKNELLHSHFHIMWTVVPVPSDCGGFNEPISIKCLGHWHIMTVQYLLLCSFLLLLFCVYWIESERWGKEVRGKTNYTYTIYYLHQHNIIILENSCPGRYKLQITLFSTPGTSSRPINSAINKKPRMADCTLRPFELFASPLLSSNPRLCYYYHYPRSHIVRPDLTRI